MNLQNGYKVIYEKIANGERTFYATENAKCDPTVDEKIVTAAIGDYKLVYEKNGQIYGSTTSVPAEGDHCFSEFDKVFKVAVEEPVTTTSEEPVAPASEEPAQTYSRRTRKTEPVVEEPATEEPEVKENNEIEE